MQSLPAVHLNNNSHSLRQHFQLPLGVSVCLFCLQVYMLCCLKCKYFCKNWPLKYKIQHKIQFCGLGSLRDTLCRFTKVNHDFTTELSIIITGLLTPNCECNVQEYFKDDGTKSTCQSQNALCGIHSDIQWMPRTVSQSMRIVLPFLPRHCTWAVIDSTSVDVLQVNPF